MLCADVARLLCGLFFASGAAALVFETLWFHQAGLAFGTGVWSAAVTLAAFMAGLALGNALAARVGSRLRRPLRVYAGLELMVGVCGIVVVLVLPTLGVALAPVLTHVAARFTVAFLVMVVPATAMGATLPVLIRPLVHARRSFASSLGALYGWNTLGAVAGVLAAELVLIEALGIRGTAIAAGLVDIGVAAVALLIKLPLKPVKPQPARVPVRWLVAAALAGGTMLALEVVWFRLLRLVQAGTALVFAVMLALVLAGIGLGGLLPARCRGASPRSTSTSPRSAGSPAQPRCSGTPCYGRRTSAFTGHRATTCCASPSTAVR